MIVWLLGISVIVGVLGCVLAFVPGLPEWGIKALAVCIVVAAVDVLVLLVSAVGMLLGRFA